MGFMRRRHDRLVAMHLVMPDKQVIGVANDLSLVNTVHIALAPRLARLPFVRHPSRNHAIGPKLRHGKIGVTTNDVRPIANRRLAGSTVGRHDLAQWERS